MQILASLGDCHVAADLLILRAVRIVGGTLRNGPPLELVVDLGATLGHGPSLEIGNIWMWILVRTGFWISMSAGTGFLMEVASEVLRGKRSRMMWT